MFENNQNSKMAVGLPRATSEIENFSNDLMCNIDIMHENLTTLENMLLPVTKPYSEVNGKNSAPSIGVPEESLSPVGESLRAAARMVDGFNGRINAIKAKLPI